MSKKTREQKIKNSNARVQQKETTPVSSAPHYFTFTSSAPTKTTHTSTVVHDTTYSYLRKDIVRTVVLAIAAIAALIVLSVVLK